jgi:site-specific DNA-methyltransferase (adenine-specific)
MIELGRIYNEDCLETMKRMEDKSVDLIVTDPPYNVGKDYGVHCDSMLDYEEWCYAWFLECLRVSNAVVLTPGMVNLNQWYGRNPRWTMCWYKSNQCSPSSLGGFNVWEPILVFGDGLPRVGQDGFSMPIKHQPDAEGHPVPKLLAAWEKLVSSLSVSGATIYDPFMGSGTTAVACERLGRKWIGSEINPDYVKIAEKRIANERAQTKMEFM